MYEYYAEVLGDDIYDGDGSFKMMVDKGMKEYSEKSVRLNGYDTPEVRGYGAEAGKVVRDFVEPFMIGKTVLIKTKYDKTGKYGRLLADIFIGDDFTINLGEALAEKGYAKAYLGGSKTGLWSEEELQKIVDSVK